MSADEQPPVKEDDAAVDPHEWLLRLSPLLQSLDIEEEEDAKTGRKSTLAQLAARHFPDFVALSSEEKCKADWDLATATFTDWLVSPLPTWYWTLLVTLHTRDATEAAIMRSAFSARLMAAERDDAPNKFQLRRINAMAQCCDCFALRTHALLNAQRAAEAFICVVAASSALDEENAELIDFYRAEFPQRIENSAMALYAEILVHIEEARCAWIIPAFLECWGVDLPRLRDFGNRTEWTDGWKALEVAMVSQKDVVWRLAMSINPKHIPMLAHAICWKVDHSMDRADVPSEYYHSEDEEAPEEGSRNHRHVQFSGSTGAHVRHALQLGETADMEPLVHEFHRIGRLGVAIDFLLWFLETDRGRQITLGCTHLPSQGRAMIALNCALDLDATNDAKNGLLLQRFVWEMYTMGVSLGYVFANCAQDDVDWFRQTVRLAQWPVPGSCLAHKLFQETWGGYWGWMNDGPPVLVPPAPKVLGCMGNWVDDPNYEDDFDLYFAASIRDLVVQGWRDDLGALVRGLFDAAEVVAAVMPDGQPATYEQLMDAIRVRLTEQGKKDLSMCK